MTQSNGKPVIQVNQLKKYFGDLHAVDGITFDVTAGEIFGILGPNGAGKTTTMEIIVGMQQATAGTVSVLGLDPCKEAATLKRLLGVQLQAVNLFPRLTVKETFNLFASFYRHPLSVDSIIDMMALEKKQNDLIMNLSGGQLRRVAIGNAIIGNGDIIFLDEPTSGLDPQSKQRLWSIIGDLQQQGKTIFMNTHFMEEAQNLCHRVCIIDHGKIIDLDTPRQLIKKHFKETAIEIAQPLGPLKQEISSFQEVARLSILKDTTKLYTGNVPQTISNLIALFKEKNIQMKDMSIRESNLEDVFLKTTGRRIRE